jgi:hypothetical protein
MTAFADPLRLRRTRRFETFCFATLLSNFGTWAQQVAEPWLLLTLASSFLIGLDSLATAAPVWLLTPPRGWLADRADRRLMISVCQSPQMLCPVLLVVLPLTGTVQPWMVIVLSTVVGVAGALSMPSFQSIVPSIVEHDQIAAGFALNATQFNLSRVLGPALAGVQMTSVGAVGWFTLNAASYLPFIWVALWILPRGKPPPSGDATSERSLRDSIVAIIRPSDPRGAPLTVLLTVPLTSSLIVFCPILVKTVLNGGVNGFSLAIAAFGVGGLRGSIGLLWIDPGRYRRRISSWLARGCPGLPGGSWCWSRSIRGSGDCRCWWHSRGWR